MVKLDYRVILTQKMFKTAFLQLLKETPIQEITIRELCTVAGVNRGTFYSHYQDIYDLLEQIESDMFEALKQTLASFDDIPGSSFYVELFRFFQNNSEMCTMLLGKNSDRVFVEKLLEFGKEMFVRTYMPKNVQINARYVELFYEFISGGCISVLRNWIENDMKESIEDVSKLVENMVVRGSVGLNKFMKTAE